MPITHNVQIKTISDEEFRLLDHKIVGLAFAIQNELGTFWNEKIYRNELAYRCQEACIEKVTVEVPIQVSYKDFSTDYFADLLINDAVVYELKAVQALTEAHRKQALNYLFLLGMQRGKLINMRPPSVEHYFVSTRITPEKRRQFTIVDQGWQTLDDDSSWLKQLLISLINEWGAFLEMNLFYEAITHFRGGEEHVIKTFEAINGSRLMGPQKIYALNSEVAFKLTAMTKDEKLFEQNLRRFMQFMPLKAMQWINFNHHQISFKTITK